MMRLQTATAITPGQKGQPAGAAVDVADRRNDPHPAEPRKQPGDVAPAELGRRHPGDQVVVEGVEHEDDGHNDVQETVRPEAGPVEDPVAADEGDRRENLGAPEAERPLQRRLVVAQNQEHDRPQPIGDDRHRRDVGDHQLPRRERQQEQDADDPHDEHASPWRARRVQRGEPARARGRLARREQDSRAAGHVHERRAARGDVGVDIEQGRKPAEPERRRQPRKWSRFASEVELRPSMREIVRPQRH